MGSFCCQLICPLAETSSHIGADHVDDLLAEVVAPGCPKTAPFVIILHGGPELLILLIPDSGPLHPRGLLRRWGLEALLGGRGVGVGVGVVLGAADVVGRC